VTLPCARLVLVAVLTLAMAGESALAHGSRGSHGGKGGHSGRSSHAGGTHHHARVGVAIATPVWGAWYSPPWGYTVDTPEWSAPVEYIEKDSGSSVPARPPAYWYYCPDSQGFYPEITECPAGWQELLSPPPAS